jgi:hypothetical protein
MRAHQDDYEPRDTWVRLRLASWGNVIEVMEHALTDPPEGHQVTQMRLQSNPRRGLRVQMSIVLRNTKGEATELPPDEVGARFACYEEDDVIEVRLVRS